MQRLMMVYDRITRILSGRLIESLALLLNRLALAGIFWRSGRTKIADGTALQIDDTQYYLFEEFGLPVPGEIAVPLTAHAEHFLPVLVALGIGTRIGAAGLLVMTMVIQLLVFPEAWWPVHSLWAAMALILVSRGGGIFSLDAIVTRLRDQAKR